MKELSTITLARDIMITKELLERTCRLQVHNGKIFELIDFEDEKKNKKIGHSLGEFILTKRLGARIHDSERNRKRKEKLLNKQKKKK